jgi:hypothetical protein
LELATAQSPEGSAEPRPRASLSGWIAPLLGGLTVAVSALGLLCTRVGVYDDSLLLVGARLVGAGRLPYRDFYTHYGPLGYFVLDPMMRGIGNPGLALRLAQAIGLALLAALLLLLLRRCDAPPGRLAFPLVALALSSAFALAAFLGFGLAAAALALFALERTVRTPTPRALLLAAAGASIAAAALTRPAFAAYAGAAIVSLELITARPGSARRLAVFLGSAAVVLPVLWLALFPAIEPRQAVEAMLVTPGRLLTVGRRHVKPHFASAPLGLPLLIGAAIAAAPLLWAFGATSRRARLLAGGAIALGAVVPLFLAAGSGRLDPALFAVFELALAIAVAIAARVSLRESPRLWAAAAFGIAASAFGHYFWSRPDSVHLYPLLGLSASSAALAWPVAATRRAWRLAALAVLALPFVPVDEDLGLPAASLSRGGWARAAENASRPGARTATIWPAGEFATPAVEAVSLADRFASPTSRFVAYGSDQAWTAGDPVFLFLLSARLPYTRWFQYDPGVQSAPDVQEEMLREAEDSGSATAVVWKSEEYRFDQPPGRIAARSAFDARIAEIYPRVVARFGGYEVRAR